MARLDVLGEDEHGGAGMRAADLRRGARPLVVEVGRHADVDDGEVRRVLAHQRQQRVRVARPPDHLVAGVLEQPGEALAQQHRVLGDHDTHGSSTAMRVPAPAGLSSASRPPWAATRSTIPASPLPDTGRRAADPVVGHDQAQALGRPRRLHRHARRRGVLDRVGERLARDVVGDGLDLRRRAVARRLELDRHRGGPREILERRGQALVEPRRAQARRDRAQVADRRRDLVHRRVERRGEDPRLPGQRALQPPQHDPERHEPLLRAVVEVALEPPALLVAGLRDPRARRLDLGQLEAQLDPQAAELHRHRRGVEHRGQHVGPLGERRDRGAARRPRGGRARSRERARPSSGSASRTWPWRSA